ncbi:hypothetical protein [Micromonospora sp. L32]|uniref:hypothetical protein n=1 Tax=Micromonospora sp. L32 TaxID=3452214 RepID=UPI003F89E902
MSGQQDVQWAVRYPAFPPHWEAGVDLADDEDDARALADNYGPGATVVVLVPAGPAEEARR